MTSGSASAFRASPVCDGCFLVGQCHSEWREDDHDVPQPQPNENRWPANEEEHYDANEQKEQDVSFAESLEILRRHLWVIEVKMVVQRTPPLRTYDAGA